MLISDKFYAVNIREYLALGDEKSCFVSVNWYSYYACFSGCDTTIILN